MKIIIISLILILIICYLIYNNNCICKNIESFVTEEVYVTDNQMNVFGSILIDTDKLVSRLISFCTLIGFKHIHLTLHSRTGITHSGRTVIYQCGSTPFSRAESSLSRVESSR